MLHSTASPRMLAEICSRKFSRAFFSLSLLPQENNYKDNKWKETFLTTGYYYILLLGLLAEPWGSAKQHILYHTWPMKLYRILKTECDLSTESLSGLISQTSTKSKILWVTPFGGGLVGLSPTTICKSCSFALSLEAQMTSENTASCSTRSETASLFLSPIAFWF